MQWEPTPPPIQPYGARPMSVGELIDGGFQVMKRNLATLVKISAAIVIPAQIITVLVNLSSQPDPSRITSTDAFGNTRFDFSNFRVTVGGAVVVLVISLIAQTIASGALTTAVSSDYLGTAADSATALRTAFNRFWPLLASGILAGMGMIFGFLACLIPGIFLAVAWSVATPALVVENLGPGRALSRSMQLVKPRFWPTLGCRVLLYLMTVIPGTIIAIPATFATNGDTRIIVSGILSMLISLLITPFSAATLVLLYFDLRVRSEGFDLQLLARSLGMEVAPGAVGQWQSQQPWPNPQAHSAAPWGTPSATTPPPPPQWGTQDVPPPPPPPPYSPPAS